jgi:hypothetical protein
MSPWPVSKKRLEDTTVRFSDGRLPHCAVVPLFEPSGDVRAVVLLSPSTQECWVLDWWPGLVYVPPFKAARMSIARGSATRATRGEGLWFHDPRGLIELAIRSLCSDFAARNAAAVLPKKVAGLIWRRDLSRLWGVSIQKNNRSGTELGRWKPDWLPATRLERQQVPTCRVTGWVLDPPWMR